MNRRIATTLVAMSMLAGAGVGLWMHQVNDQPAQAEPEPTATATAPSQPQGTDELIIGPGRIGPVLVGMSIDDALATGEIVRDTEREEICGGSQFYRWKDDAAHASMDVMTDETSVVSLGVSRGSHPTDQDIRVGDSLFDLREAYGAKLSDPAEAGYGQTGVVLGDGDRWIGFLFDEAPADLDESSRITFIEVTEGEAPGLMRDGC